MRQNRSPFSRWIWLAPLLVIPFLYNEHWRKPQLKVIQTRLQKYNKLVASTSGLSDEIASIRNERLSLEQELNHARTALDEVKQDVLRIGQRRHDIQSELLYATQPARELSRTVGLFREHNLRCVDSHPVKTTSKSLGNIHDSHQKMIELLGNTTGLTSNRIEYRIKVKGLFSNLQSALHALRDSMPEVTTLSVEMEESLPVPGDRTWILSLLF